MEWERESKNKTIKSKQKSIEREMSKRKIKIENKKK